VFPLQRRRKKWTRGLRGQTFKIRLNIKRVIPKKVGHIPNARIVQSVKLKANS
jgi:hypothetical protein